MTHSCRWHEHGTRSMCCRHIWALACVVIHSRQETSGHAGSTISDSESAYNRFISVHVMHVDWDNTTKTKILDPAMVSEPLRSDSFDLQELTSKLRE
jgi:hypothetical protein